MLTSTPIAPTSLAQGMLEAPIFGTEGEEKGRKEQQPSTNDQFSVSCGPDCIPKYEELKLKKSHRYIIFKLSGDMKSIEVEKWSHDPDWESFVGDLPETDCRYAVYDFQFESSEGKR